MESQPSNGGGVVNWFAVHSGNKPTFKNVKGKCPLCGYELVIMTVEDGSALICNEVVCKYEVVLDDSMMVFQ